MKPQRIIALSLVLMLSIFLTNSGLSQTTGDTVKKTSVKLFYVYSDKGVKNSNFFAPSGWLGDYADLTFKADCSDNPYAGSTCIKITYRSKASGGTRWAGIYWQNPANNWGDIKEAGVNLTGIKRLTFWARGEKGDERIEEFKIGGINGLYPDSDTAKIGPLLLTTQWKQYTIELTGKNLSHIIGGFAWSANLENNSNGCTFYLDEIRYE